MGFSRRNILSKLSFFPVVLFSIYNKRANANESEDSRTIMEVNSFEELRKLVPSFEKQSVFLNCWDSHYSFGQDYNFGCGRFFSVKGNANDDGGSIAKVNKSWYWVRDKNIDDYTILDFGAIPDGTTDCSNAFIAMYKWSQKLGNGFFKSPPGVIFPRGSFYISNVDLSSDESQHFIIRGPFTSFGYDAKTTIITDDNAEAIFKTKARQIEIFGLNFDGTRLSSPKGILDNTRISGGTFNRLSNVWIRDFTGVCFTLSDTLDTKIDQFYANNCTGGIFKIVYDNSPKGNWNHSTAVELTNFNFQDCYPGMVINAPRCLQSVIRNGWFERSNCGDLSNGEWYVENMSVENCEKFGVLSFKNTRLVELCTNQLASKVERGYDQSNAWLKSFKPGQVSLNNFGLSMDGYIASGFLAPNQLIVNNSEISDWFLVGKLWLPFPGDIFKIVLFGIDLNFDQASSHDLNFETTLLLVKTRKLVINCNLICNPSCAVEFVAIESKVNSSCVVYAKLKAHSRVSVFCSTNVLHDGTKNKLNWQPSIHNARVVLDNSCKIITPTNK